MLLVMVLGLIYVIVLVERAQRKITIQYPKRQMGARMMSSENSHLPLKINPTGVIPPIFASSLLLLPITIANFSAENGPSWVQTLSQLLGHGQPLYLSLYAALIIFFAFFYTAIVFNPEETAENLKSTAALLPVFVRVKYCRLSGLCHYPSDGFGCGLFDCSVHPAGSLNQQIVGSVRFGRHNPADRGSGDHGLCRPAAVSFDCLSV